MFNCNFVHNLNDIGHLSACISDRVAPAWRFVMNRGIAYKSYAATHLFSKDSLFAALPSRGAILYARPIKRRSPMPLPKATSTAEDYWALPDGVRAELIDGELWDLASPSRVHQKIVHALDYHLESHIRNHHGSCEVYPAPFAVNLFADDTTFVEPDISVICDTSKLSDRGCEGAPDFVVEVVSPSSRGMDYVSKLNLYQAAGVREYWICDPERRHTLAYDLEGETDVHSYSFSAAVPSAVFPDFEICFGDVLG